MPKNIEPGFMIFLADGQSAAGAVREVKDSGGLVVNVENGGDFDIAADAVSDVHEGKVILHLDRLPDSMQEALRHLHDAEYPIYRADDPAQGTPEDPAMRDEDE